MGVQSQAEISRILVAILADTAWSRPGRVLAGTTGILDRAVPADMAANIFEITACDSTPTVANAVDTRLGYVDVL